MKEDNITDPLVDGVKTAVLHFGKAAFEVANGVGALFVGITKTVKPGADGHEDDDSGPQTVEVE